jgi:hypothetical protein
VEGYRSTRMVVRSFDESRQMLEEALSSLRAWRRRYRHLSELSDVFHVIEQRG